MNDMATKAQLKKWFSTGAYPTGAQFAELIDSFVHTTEGELDASRVKGLTELLTALTDLAGGADANASAGRDAGEQARRTAEEVRRSMNRLLESVGAAGGIAALDDEGKIPGSCLPDGIGGTVWLRGMCPEAEWPGAGEAGLWFLTDAGKVKAVTAEGAVVTKDPKGGVVYVDEGGRGLWVWTGTEMRQLRGESGMPIVEHAETETTATIAPDVLHRWGEVASLTLDFAAARDGCAGEYCVEFVSGETPTVLSLPASVRFPDEPLIDANMRYQLSVVNNVGLMAGVEL